MKQVALQKEKIVNAVEIAKEFVPIESALKIFTFREPLSTIIK
jgi:hypothetical protein